MLCLTTSRLFITVTIVFFLLLRVCIFVYIFNFVYPQIKWKRGEFAAAWIKKTTLRNVLQLFASNRFCGFLVDIHILFCFVWVTDELRLSVCMLNVFECVCVLYVACSIGVLVWVCSVCMCLFVFALYTLYLLFITEVHLIWHSEIVVFKCIFFTFVCMLGRKTRL